MRTGALSLDSATALLDPGIMLHDNLLFMLTANRTASSWESAMLQHLRCMFPAAIVLCSSAAVAADLAVPILEKGGDGQAANCMSSVVEGLRQGRDSFLAVRSGPGADFAKLAELKNGETVIIFETKGEWAGIVYRTANVKCSSKTTQPVTFERKGWVHTRWLRSLAG